MSISSIKKILLAGTALVAVAAFGAQAQAVTDTISAAGTTSLAADPAATPAITFAAGSTTASIVNDPTGQDYLATAGDTVTNTSGTNDIGTIVLQGVTGVQHVAGAVGTSAGTGSLFNVTAGATGGTSDFAGAVYAETVTLGGGATTFSSTVNGAMTLGTGTVSTGLVTGNLTFSGAGAATLNGGLAGNIDFAGANGVVNLESGQSIAAGAGTGAVNNTGAAGNGTLILVGGTQTVAGAVGATHALSEVTAGTNAPDVSNFSSSVNATTIQTDAGALNITGLATGNLDFAGTGNGTTTLTGGLGGTGNIDFAGLGGTVKVGAVGVTVTGITGAVNNSAGTGGTLDLLGGTQTVTGAVGLTGALTTVSAGVSHSDVSNFSSTVNTGTFAVGAGTATVTGDLTATNITVAAGIGSGGSLNLNGATNSGAVLFAPSVITTVPGTVTIAGGSDFTGTSTIGGSTGVAGTGVGNVIFSGASSDITSIGVTGVLKSLTVGGAVSTTGNVLAADTTTLGANTLTVGGTFVAGAGQKIVSSIAAGGTLGHVAATGTATTATTTFVDLTSAYTGAGGTFVVVSGASGGSVAHLANSELEVNAVTDTGKTTVSVGNYTYSQLLTGAGLTNLEIVATRNTVTGAAITANDAALDAALNAISVADAGCSSTACNQLKTAITAVDTAAGVSPAAAHTALQALMPAGADGGAQGATLNVTADIQEIATGRLTALRDGDTTSGVAAGASSHGVSMWLEGYGQHANQDMMDGVNGYGATTWGGAVGVDLSAMFDKAIVGVALNYGSSVVNSSDANTTTTDLGNYGINVYGTYDLGQKMFVNGQVGFAYNTVDSTRHNVGVGLNADGSTSSDEYSAKLDAGRDYPVGGGMTLTPDVSAAYTYLNTAGYTETGAGGLDNTVASNSQNALGLGIGGTAAWKIHGQDDDVFKPSLHVGYTYEAIDDKVQTSSSFAGDPSGTIFINEGASPARSIFDVGAKVVYATKANWDFSANYDFQAKQDYTSNTGELRATAHF